MLKSLLQKKSSWALLGIFLSALPSYAKWDLECYIKNNCGRSWGSTTTNPSSGSQVKINPSAVPTEAGFGVEGLFYKSEVDIAVVRGTGRVGAAISPSNSEETFFGPPGFESEQKYFERKVFAEKFPNQKFTLAAAANLLNKHGSGLKSYSLKLGVMGKYNKITKDVSPGVGLNGVLGFLTFGGSVYLDETVMPVTEISPAPPPEHIQYLVQTYNIGLFLNSVILDYSHLRLEVRDVPTPSEVTLFTASLMVKKFIFTLAQRAEKSERASYNYETQTLEQLPIKEEAFGGIQYSVNKNLMFGAFYNYYMLREGSVAATLFF